MTTKTTTYGAPIPEDMTGASEFNSTVQTVLRTGSTALLVYPSGDVDHVTILSLQPDAATVRLPDGRTYITVIEDLGIGVDDTISAVFDDGTRYPPLSELELRYAYGDR